MQVSSCPKIWENPEYWNQDAGAENESTWGHGRGAKLEKDCKAFEMKFAGMLSIVTHWKE